MDSLPLFSKGKNCLWKNILGSAGAECESSKNECKLMPEVLKKGKLLFLTQEQELVVFISKRNLLRRWMLVVPLKIIYIAIVWAPLYLSLKLFSEKKHVHSWFSYVHSTDFDWSAFMSSVYSEHYLSPVISWSLYASWVTNRWINICQQLSDMVKNIKAGYWGRDLRWGGCYFR